MGRYVNYINKNESLVMSQSLYVWSSEEEKSLAIQTVEDSPRRQMIARRGHRKL